MKRAFNAFLVFGLSAFFLLTASSFVSATESIQATKEPVIVHKPLYVGIFGGFVVPSDLKVENGVKTKIQLDNTWTAGAKAGYIWPVSWNVGAKAFGVWLAAELEYAHLANHSVDEEHGTGDFNANNMMVNLILKYPEGVIRPYIGAGAGWSRGKFEGSYPPTVATMDDTDDSLGWQALAGINMEITPSLSVDFAYRFFSSKYKLNNLDATIRDHIVLAGLNYHFGGSKPAPPPVAPVVEEKKCPDTPSCCTVDKDGCPVDSDGDGVCDSCDKCPDTPQCCKVDKDGCPIDSDGDGVCDGCDKCPDTPQCCKVDKDGCPIDSDGDGVCDGCDKCPDTLQGCKVDKDGCPIDSDGDGVCDGRDKCPDTPAGVKVDKDGCPPPVVEEMKPVEAVEKEIVEKGRTTLNVLFDFDKATIRKNSFKDIDTLADVMKKYGDVNITIEGHTDYIGSNEYNKKLSQRRAGAIKKYLVEKAGIDEKRLTAVGFGEEKPVASNKTAEGRQKNRRVEAVADYIIKK